MNGGLIAIISSIVAIVAIFLLGKKKGESEGSDKALKQVADLAQTVSDTKSQASAEVAQAKVEIAQVKSEESKAQVEKIESDIRSALLQSAVKAVVNLVGKNQQSDPVMQELANELETAKRYNNMEQVIDVARKQAARAVEKGMTATSEENQ